MHDPDKTMYTQYKSERDKTVVKKEGEKTFVFFSRCGKNPTFSFIGFNVVKR